MKNLIFFEAEIGDNGLKFEARYSANGNGIITFITRHGVDDSFLQDAVELRLLGEAVRVAGLKAVENENAASFAKNI